MSIPITCTEIEYTHLICGLTPPEHCGSCHSEWGYFEDWGEDWRVDDSCCTISDYAQEFDAPVPGAMALRAGWFLRAPG